MSQTSKKKYKVFYSLFFITLFFATNFLFSVLPARAQTVEDEIIDSTINEEIISSSPSEEIPNEDTAPEPLTPEDTEEIISIEEPTQSTIPLVYEPAVEENISEDSTADDVMSEDTEETISTEEEPTEQTLPPTEESIVEEAPEEEIVENDVVTEEIISIEEPAQSAIPSVDTPSGANLISTPNLDPTIEEQLTENGKLVVISATEEQELLQDYINVPVSTLIPEIFRVGQEDQIKINWQNNGNEEMEFVATDDDNDGFIDHLAWIVPHLSVQTFEIIYISKALHLDADKNIIADIYDVVSTKDQNYASLLDGQYVRVTFEKLLDNTKDITIYAKATNANEPVTIQVYTLDGELIATFENIILDGKYRILLTNLVGEADVFDLKIIGNVEIDQIIDPPATAYWVGGGAVALP